MKVLVFPIIIIIAGIAIFIYLQNKKKKHKKPNFPVIGIFILIILTILGFGIFKMIQAASIPDTQCTTTHSTTSHPPQNLQSAMDFFMQGNYDYDIGNCTKAIVDYTVSIQMDPNNPKSYNNRAYTYMRMQDYVHAFSDLNKAIELKPNYVEALMNRGDLYNYYGPIFDRKKAALDYRKVILLGGAQSTSVCGHLFLAEHNGWNLGTILDLPLEVFNACRR